MTCGSVPWICLAALVFTAGTGPEPVSGEPGPAPEQSTSIGVYLDPGGTRSTLTDPPIGYPFSLYVVLKGMPSLVGWEALVVNPFAMPDAMVMSTTLMPPGSIDFGTNADNWIVATPGCTGTGPNQALAVVEYRVLLFTEPCFLVENPFWIVDLGPAQPSGFTPPAPGWVDCSVSPIAYPFDDIRFAFLGGCTTSGVVPYFVQDPAASPASGSAPLEVQFSAVAFDDDTPQDELQYYWFFDDGGSSVGQSPTHVYSSPGTYRAWVNVYDGSNDKSGFVQVEVSVTGIGDTPESPVRALQVAASPNPFRSRTQLSYSLPEAGPVSVRLIDHRGRLVRTLDPGEQRAGVQALTWDGRDDRGARLPAGIYLGRVQTSEGAGSVRIVHLD